MKKTNAIRILDQHKLSYQLVTYTYDPDNLSVENMAKNNGLAAASVFKTLVAKGDKTGIVVAVVAGDSQLNYKALAKISHNKKISLIPVKEIQTTTSYIRGACSLLGMKKQFPVFLDEAAGNLDMIYVNAGQRGLLFGISPQELIQVTNAVMAPISLKNQE